MLKNEVRKNSGITLIALVVTIIVLLILAGISISMLTGQNGILNRAKEAKENTIQGKKDEEDELSNLESYIDNILSNNEFTNFTVRLSEPEQIYALGRLLNENTCQIAGLTSYSGSEQEKIDLALFRFPEKCATSEEKKNFLQMASYILENDINITIQRTSDLNCFLGIGGDNNPFKGIFNGNNKTISITMR